MARFLQRLGAGVHRLRILVVLFWLAALAAVAVAAGTTSGTMSSDFELPGQESTDAIPLLGDRLGGGDDDGASATVVFDAGDGADLTTALPEVAATIAALRGIDGVVSVTDPFDPAAPSVSADLRIGVSTVTFDSSPLDLAPESREELLDTAEDARSAALSVDLTGSAVISTEEGGHGELIGIVVALIVLTVTYGALVVAGMNLVTALVGVGIGTLGITAATGFIELQATTPALALMLGLAVGVDYSLFVISRFRSELRAGSPVPQAVSTTVATAGSAVVVAGLTVVIALAGLAVVGIPFLTQMGLAAAFTVVVAVLVSITLTPAMLGVLGRRALPRRHRRTYLAVQRGEAVPSEPSPAERGGFFGRWISGVTRRPGLSLAVTGAGLLLVSVPVLSMQTSLVTEPVPGTTQARAERLLAQEFGEGSQSPVTVLFDGQDAVDAAVGLVAEFGALPGAAAVTPAVPTPNGTAAIATVVPAHGPTDEATEDLVRDLRSVIREAAPDADIYVTGSTAVNVDVASALNRALPEYLAVIVGLAFLLLVLVFRSLLVPLIGVLGFVLTIGASLGATVAVFQWGWLAGPLGLETTGPIISLTPILMVGILFGLAMDYQIFLVSRMHEAHSRGHDPLVAIRAGFRTAAPVVVAAALIMFAIFAGFFPGGDATLKAIAFSLGAGIAIDAFVVRMVVVPAAMALAGPAAWRLPRWLGWLPRLDVEGAEVADRARHDTPTSLDVREGTGVHPDPSR